MDVKISVIVPIYKVEDYLDECLKSILNQTYQNIEVILVDDGSPDRCPIICDEYAKTDPRIIVVHKENGGLSDARNTGIKIATGDYLIFIDSDDFWTDNNALDKLVRFIINNSQCDIIFFGRTTFINDSGFVNSTISPTLINGKTKYEALKALLRDAEFIGSACQKLIRRRLIVDNDLYFKKNLLSEDWDWSIALYLLANKFGAISDNFYGYRKRVSSISQNFSLKHANDILWIISKWTNILPKTSDMAPFKGFLAYCLCCTLGSIELLPEKDKHIRDKFKLYTYLLSYDINPKVKMVKKINKILGFNITVKILGYYLKFRPKRLK